MIKKLLWTKRKLLGAAVICVILMAGLTILWQTGQVAEATILEPHPGLVGWWRFDEGKGGVAEDSSGLGNDGVLKPDYPNNSPTWVDGKHGKALNFDGVDDYVEVGDSPSIRVSATFTLEAWVKYSVANGSVILKKAGAGYISYSLETRIGGNIMAHYYDVEDKNVMSALAYNDGKWHHVVGRFDALTGIKLYVDCEEVGIYSGALSNIDTSGRVLMLGWGEVVPANYYFNGVIDEVRIYDRALSAAEIQESFQKGPNFSSRLLAKVPKGTTQFIVTLSWQGLGSTNITIESPSKNYTEDMVSVYQRTDYSSSSGDMLNIKRLAISVTALPSDENWYVVLEFDNVEDYRITEVQR